MLSTHIDREASLHVSPPAAAGRPEDPPLENELDFSYYTATLIRYWPLLLVGALIGASLGLAVAMRRPTLYESAATLLVTQGTPQAIATSRALLENNTLAAETVAETGLDRPPFDFTAQRFLQSAVRIGHVPATDLLRVVVTLRDPEKAAAAANLLSAKALDLNRRIARTETDALRGQLQEHLDAAAGRLENAEKQLLAYRDEAQLEVLQKDAETMLDERAALLRLMVRIESEKARLASAEQEIQKHDPILPAARSVGAEEALRRVDPPGRPGAADPEALDLSNPFINPVHQTLSFQIATSRTRLAALERERRELAENRKVGAARFRELSELYRRELTLARLQADYDLAAQVHGDVALRLEQTRTDVVGRAIQLQLVDAALPPDQPLPKRRAQTTALGAALGLVLAILAALTWSARPRHGPGATPAKQ